MNFDDLARVKWIHGAPDCSESAESPLQIHRTGGDIFVIRQGKCSNFEAPFIYLILGSERSLLIGTGAHSERGSPIPLRQMVDAILEEQRVKDFPITVAHSHSHGDHAANDRPFVDRPNTEVVNLGMESVRNFFGLTEWPEGSAVLELGDRSLTVIPTPGHESSDISIHDPKTKTVFTGDILYPGMLIIRDWSVYVSSIERLDRLNRADPFDTVLCAHIEMTNVPGKHHPYRTRYQPDEHVLPLRGRDLSDLLDALTEIGDQPELKVLDHFIIYPI